MAAHASIRCDWDLNPKKGNVPRPPPVVIDDLDRHLQRSEYLRTKEKILQSARLLTIMWQPQCKIAELPDKMATKQQFYCGSCKQIPFPWARDPEIEKVEEAVFLCVNGHAVCRTCYRMKGKCIIGDQDIANIYGASPPKSVIGDIQPVRNSQGNWGELKMCSSSFRKGESIYSSSNPCRLWTDMIKKAEFACKNYYTNWCEFRGSGMVLTEHEKECQKDKKKKKKKKEEQPQVEKTGDVIDIFGSPEYHEVTPDNSVYNSDKDADDKDIETFDLEQARMQVLEMIDDSQGKVK